MTTKDNRTLHRDRPNPFLPGIDALAQVDNPDDLDISAASDAPHRRATEYRAQADNPDDHE